MAKVGRKRRNDDCSDEVARRRAWNRACCHRRVKLNKGCGTVKKGKKKRQSERIAAMAAKKKIRIGVSWKSHEKLFSVVSPDARRFSKMKEENRSHKWVVEFATSQFLSSKFVPEAKRVSNNLLLRNTRGNWTKWTHVKKISPELEQEGECGLFASRRFHKDDKIGVHIGEKCSFHADQKADLRKENKLQHFVGCGCSDGSKIVRGCNAGGGVDSGKPAFPGMHFVNNANVEKEHAQQKKSISANVELGKDCVVVAKQRIEPGEQLILCLACDVVDNVGN